MDVDYGENLKQALLKFQESLNEIITNTYLSGFQDGQEAVSGVSGNEINTSAEDKFINFISELNPDNARALSEAEQILKEYS